ncbi:TraR/DksA C4-type zinc finger protein [Paenibacillus tritici]|uniref:TraR/DksA C4-type zinc finger protein n=1 Tax=Paenibacillus tritici TaxID=1873425 RepID=A0ABX2DKB2_9BACL|nr:TraR/DksA C4-type zinc finger protein [Paenibacillus tritici]NQX44099.1 TraR/DksA C4-type zinc finger protein [Paenibacillus tritici]QUL57737.1 TraR/DksA C4-type zinc finger protein [Paenibacillus tritici]
MSHLTEAQKTKLKQSLEERKAELEQHFSSNGAEDSLLGDSLTLSTGELSSVDNHPADTGTETFERSRDLSINTSLSEELSEIEAALERMEQGTYGICEASKQEIPYERLEAIPFTRYTVEHAPARRDSGERPVEEEVITPPPSGAGQGRQEHSGRFDDAGAWEAVQDYGSASSPVTPPGQDIEEEDS